MAFPPEVLVSIPKPAEVVTVVALVMVCVTSLVASAAPLQTDAAVLVQLPAETGVLNRLPPISNAKPKPDLIV